MKKYFVEFGKKLIFANEITKRFSVLKKFLDFVIVFNVILDDVVSSRFFFISIRPKRQGVLTILQALNTPRPGKR